MDSGAVSKPSALTAVRKGQDYATVIIGQKCLAFRECIACMGGITDSIGLTHLGHLGQM